MGPRTRRQAKDAEDTGTGGTSSVKGSKVAKADKIKKTPTKGGSSSKKSTGRRQSTRVAAPSVETAAAPASAGEVGGDSGFASNVRLSGNVSPQQAKDVIATPSTENAEAVGSDGEVATGREEGAIQSGLIDHGPAFSNVQSGVDFLKFKNGLMPPNKSSTPAIGRRVVAHPSAAAGPSKRRWVVAHPSAAAAKGPGAEANFGFDQLLESDNDETAEFPSSINMSSSLIAGKSYKHLAEHLTNKQKKKNRSDWLTVLNDCGGPSGSRGNTAKVSSKSPRNSEPVKDPELFVDENPSAGRKRQKKRHGEDRASDTEKAGKRKRQVARTDSPDKKNTSPLPKEKQRRLDSDDDNDNSGKDQKILHKKEGKENVACLKKQISAAAKFKLTVQ